MSETEHPLAEAIKPLLDAVGARALPPQEARPDDDADLVVRADDPRRPALVVD